MYITLTVFVAFQLLNAVHLFSMAFAARLLNVGLNRIEIGIGPPIYRGKLFSFHWLPLGGNVHMKDEDLGVLKDGEVVNFAGRMKVLVMALFGVLGLLAFAYTVLGTAAFTVLLDGFKQILLSLWYPHQVGLAELRKFDHFVRASDSHDVVAAIVAMKMLALNLIPVGMSNGLQILKSLVPVCRDTRGLICAMFKSVSITVFLAIAVIWYYLLFRHYLLGI